MRITIKNLPPIASGNFELRPLTIFIGANNTGKTRAGLLAYALAKSLDEPFNTGLYSQWPATYVRERSMISYDDRPDRLIELLVAHARLVVQERLPQLVETLLGVTTATQTASPPSVRYEAASHSSVSIGAQLEADPATSGFGTPAWIAQEWAAFQHLNGTAAHAALGSTSEPLDSAFWRTLRSKRGFPGGSAYYLPAGRGAFAASWGFLTGVTLERFGDTDAVATLPQIVRDYLRLLLNAAYLYVIAKPGDSALSSTVDLLERSIMRGRVTGSGNPSVPFPLHYSNIFDEEEERFTIDLSRASSSINEVGPLTMVVGSVVRRGDLVVIDEPESHLHPENQRRIARALVRMATAGVTVIAPTHSHTIVHEVSNMIRASLLDRSSAERLGYLESERLSPTDVGVYVFRDNGSGITIEELPFEHDFGYAEETFFEVAQTQSDDSFKIDLASEPSHAE